MKKEKIRFVHDTPYSGHYEKYIDVEQDYGQNTADLSSWSPTVNEVHNADLGGGRKGQYDYPNGLKDIKDFDAEPNLAVLRNHGLDRTEVEQALEIVKRDVENIKNDVKNKIDDIKKQANTLIKESTDTTRGEKAE